MKDGDVVEIEIDGIGVLRNPVVAERRPRVLGVCGFFAVGSRRPFSASSRRRRAFSLHAQRHALEISLRPASLLRHRPLLEQRLDPAVATPRCRSR